jgi:hypothetical protein
MADDELRTEWPIHWSAVWVGALVALSVALIIGLAGISVGAHKVGVRLASSRDLGLGALVFSVFGAFLSFAAGAWVANRLAGHRQAENAIVHGAIVWTLTVPMLLLFAALGAGAYWGGWYGGLAGTPAWVNLPGADPHAAVAARNSALGAVTALLIGLAGSVVGGWLASGQPMRLWGQYEHASNKPRRTNP